MPVYGGITWSDTERTRDFLKNKCYYIGAGENRAEYVRQLYRVQMGDILYLEQKRGNTTEVMAIGFVVSNKFERIRIGGRDMGFGRYVQWVRDFADEPRKLELPDSERSIRREWGCLHREDSDKISKQIHRWIAERFVAAEG